MKFLGLLLFLDLFLHGNTVVSMSGPVKSLAFESAVARLEIRKYKIFLTLEMIILTFLALAFLVSSAGFGPSSEMIYSLRIKFAHLLTACTNTILHVGHIRVAEPADGLGVLLRTLCCCVVQGLGIVLKSLDDTGAKFNTALSGLLGLAQNFPNLIPAPCTWALPEKNKEKI